MKIDELRDSENLYLTYFYSQMVTDVEILNAFQKNMDEGGKLLFQRYYRPLVLFSGSLLEDLTSPEDIVQDIFYQFIRTKAYGKITPDSLSTYLFRSVRNACLNKIQREKEYLHCDLLAYDTIEEKAITISPEIITAIRQAIDQLPEKTRAVILSVVIGGKKYKETAENLNISVNTVKTLLNHGLKLLRKQFPDPFLLFFIFRHFPS